MKQNIPKIQNKQFKQDGKWIVKPSRTDILMCSCGNKYIKTRDGQTNCVRCIAETKR